MQHSTQSQFSCHYFLTLAEAKQGFALASFGKNKFNQYLTPLISIAMIIWGVMQGWATGGRFMIILGVVFLLSQLAMRFYILPAMFKKQYEKLNFAQTQHGIDLYQDEFILTVGDNQQTEQYQNIVRFAESELVYLIELQSKAVFLISKQAVKATGKQDFFESAMKR